jgi:hypothetical protein
MKPCDLLFVLAALGAQTLRATEVQIGSVPAEYTMTFAAFQIDAETQRARVVLRYTWPDYVTGGDTGPGLHSVPVQIQGLRYDASSRQVVYSAGNEEAVCATVRQRRFLLWTWASVSPTGECVVNSRRIPHVEDTRWNLQRREMTDTFLDIR